MLLLIIAPREVSLHRYLTARFAGVSGVQIIFERRHGERRRAQVPHEPDRRAGADRRHEAGERSAAFGVTLARIDEATSAGP